MRKDNQKLLNTFLSIIQDHKIIDPVLSMVVSRFAVQMFEHADKIEEQLFSIQEVLLKGATSMETMVELLEKQAESIKLLQEELERTDKQYLLDHLN